MDDDNAVDFMTNQFLAVAIFLPQWNFNIPLALYRLKKFGVGRGTMVHQLLSKYCQTVMAQNLAL